ncbi:MAG: hypothetical protein LBQ60_05865 [Bacteroidales bacterium]|jgi:C-terminal processing protease CtpA/Prc|nr:hypothetical protein [Bacteroidales bacterium]
MKYLIYPICTFYFLACGYIGPQQERGQIGPPERPESKYIIKEMKFETDAQLYYVRNATVPWVSKWIRYGNVRKDSTDVAEGKYSLQLQDNCDIYYYLDASRIEGDSLIFSGKYKFNNTQKGKLFFYILQKDRYESSDHPPVPDSLIIQTNIENSDWKSFIIRAKLKPGIQEIRFGLKTENIKYAWIDDWDIQVDSIPVYRYIKVRYPAEEDREFDNGSGIYLKEVSPITYQNLDILGRVWGFLKYYHPAIIDGDINWDYELLRILPEAAHAKDKKKLNKILYNWIEKLGDFPVTSYKITANDSLFYSCFIDNSWINNEEVFSEEMIRMLDKVKNAVRHEKVNYYTIPFAGGARSRNFRAEKSYDHINWDDQGYRLLSLFRFWNVMEYNFPYKYLTNKPWSKVLSEYIPEICSVDTQSQYLALLMKLTAEINDSHGRFGFKGSLQGSPVERLQYRRYPVVLTETDKGEFCVENVYNSELQLGDIILSIDGKPINEIFDELTPYIVASNRQSLSRNIRRFLMSTKGTSLNVEINRNGKVTSLALKDFSRNKIATGVKTMANYEKENQDILFLNVGTTTADDLVTAVKKNMSAKGIVFDLRQYPRTFLSFAKLADILLPDTVVNLWFSSQDLTFPGNYKKYNERELGFKNPNYFKGKVAILVNEHTQSLGEMTAIALSRAPQAAVIGSTTAGADGNVTSFVLPGGMNVSYTVFSAYYPDWVLCQRTGVKIDIHARPSVKDFLERKDALIEKAIEYIRQ